MTWALTDHACRFCLGPVISCERIFRCAVCDHTAEDEPLGICGCGLQPRGIGKKPGFFMCAANPKRTPANPARIVIAFAADPPPATAKAA